MKKLSEVLSIPVLPFQKDTIIYQLKHKYVINGSEMGTGKTVMGIAHALVSESKTLIVCPAYLKSNWEREINKFSLEKQSILNVGETSEMDIAIYGDYNFVIMSYDRFTKIKNDVSFDMVVFDEIHYLKNMDTMRTKKAIEYIDYTEPKYLLGLSGTPVTKGITDWYSLLYLISMDPTNSNGHDVRYLFPRFNTFANYFANSETMKLKTKYNKKVSIKKYFGVRHFEEFKKLLTGKYIRNLAQDHLDLPPLILTPVSFRDKSISDDGLDKEFDEFEKTNSPIQSRKSQFAYLKTKFTKKYAMELHEAGEGPLVIFTDHLNPAQKLVEELRKSMSLNLINGNTPPEKRQGYVDKLQAGELDCLVCTIGAAMTGFTMTKAKNVIFNDLSWVPANNAQAIKRLHRYGQKNQVIAHIICGGEVDEKINQVLERKITDLAKIT